MDTRRFDKNADQLAQIMAHIATIPQHQYHNAMMDRHNMLKALEACLVLNDSLARMAEKGLI